jgi:hypothetical protein
MRKLILLLFLTSCIELERGFKTPVEMKFEKFIIIGFDVSRKHVTLDLYQISSQITYKKQYLNKSCHNYCMLIGDTISVKFITYTDGSSKLETTDLYSKLCDCPVY